MGFRSASNALPGLSPGFGFKLEGDGQWDVQRIPEDVLRTAEFSGEITIKGYPCSVFETPDKDQWAQKVSGTPAPKGDQAVEEALGKMASRVARMAGKTAKRGLEPNIARAATAMLEELKAAEASLDKARQFSRVLRNEQSLEWMVDQVEASHDALKGVVSGIEESLAYLSPDE